MTTADCLRRARELIAGGWSGPGALELFCRDSTGIVCKPTAEGITKFSVRGALQASAHGDMGAAYAAWDELARIATPAMHALDNFEHTEECAPEELAAFRALCVASEGQPDFEAWLEHPSRTVAHVLRCFDLAIHRAKRQEAA